MLMLADVAAFLDAEAQLTLIHQEIVRIVAAKTVLLSGMHVAAFELRV